MGFSIVQTSVRSLDSKGGHTTGQVVQRGSFPKEDKARRFSPKREPEEFPKKAKAVTFAKKSHRS